MVEVSKKQRTAHRVILKCRTIAWLFPVCSLGVLLGATALTTQVSAAEFFARLSSPGVVLLLGLLSLIYLPASVRIYYICLLKATGVFTAAERQAYQSGKQRWDKLLLRAALFAGILIVLLAFWRWVGS